MLSFCLFTRDRLVVEPNSFTTVFLHLSRTLETLNKLLLHFVGKSYYQMTSHIYLPFVVKSTNAVAERIYKVASTWCCLKHLRKICTYYYAHFCRMKNDMASG